MEFGVTNTGFKKKTQQGFIDELVNSTKAVFGEDFDLRESTLQYNILAVLANTFSYIEDQQESLHNQRTISNATGIHLDYAVAQLGLRRRQPSFSDGPVTIQGTNGTIVPENYLVQTQSGIQFRTTETTTIALGSANLDVMAVVAGSNGNVGAGTITVITNPLSGITGVINSAAMTGGQDAESDSALRLRYSQSLALGGGGSTNSIRASLLEIQGVVDAIVRENTTDSVDANGLPAHSFNALIVGGSNADLHTAILRSKPAGIRAFGDVTATLTDDSGNSVTVGFTRPTDVDIYINATVTHTSSYPSDGDTRVKDLIIEHINALRIGEDVVLYRISSQIGSSVAGITNLTLQSSTDGTTYTNNDIAITAVQRAVTDTNKVVVT